MRLVRDKNFYRTIFRISLPTAFSSLVSFLVVVADDIMVSSITNGVTEGYGKIAQAAVSQVNALTAFFTATLLGLVSGSSVLISQYWGKKDMPRIKRLFSIVFAVSMAVTLLFVLAARLFPEPVIRLVLRAGDESAAEATRLALAYFAIVCFSWIPYAVTNSLTGMLRSVEVVRVTLYVSVASLVMNISLNYVLIFGKLGLPAMGVEGAALATVLTRVIEMLIVAFYTFRVQKVVDVRPRDFFTFDRALAHDYARYGLPVGLTDMQWSFIGLLKAAIIGRLTTYFIAANAITSAMMNLGTMFTFALAGGACVMVGKAVGRGDYDTAREYSRTIQVMFALIGVCMCGGRVPACARRSLPAVRLRAGRAGGLPRHADDRHRRGHADRHQLPCVLLRGHQPRRGRQPLRRRRGYDLRLARRAARHADRRALQLAAARRVPHDPYRPVLQMAHRLPPPARG